MCHAFAEPGGHRRTPEDTKAREIEYRRTPDNRAQRALLDEVARGAYRLEPFSAHDAASALVVVRSYPGLEIGLADASIVVLAERYGVLDVLTLDHRHFNSMRGPGRRRFRLLPAP